MPCPPVADAPACSVHGDGHPHAPTTATGIGALALGNSKTASMAESAPIPQFLQQTRGELHNKFIDLEWQQRHRLAMGMQAPATEGSSASPWARLDSTSNAEILRRNRYLNVEPFAANRVRLRVPESHSDYINASPITLRHTLSGTEQRYIATQGPKGDSQSHLWRMAYAESGAEGDPAVIVMLTQTHESGKEKCFQYFPLDMDAPTLGVNEEDEFSDGFRATLTLQSIEDDAESGSTIRTIDLTTTRAAAAAISTWPGPRPPSSSSASASASASAAEPAEESQTIHKTVHHLLFSGWPDFLVPEGPDRAALLKLIAKSRSLNRPASNPRIVHCSAGVGRSGTFIALDYLLHELAEGAWDDPSAFAAADARNASTPVDEDLPAGQRDSIVLATHKDPVLDCVDGLRKQRMMMVQSEGQYVFLYDVCREAWLHRWAALRPQRT